MRAGVSFFVPGIPKPAGSKRAFIIKGRAVITDANNNARDWKIDVQHAAKAASDQMEGNLFSGPIKVIMMFLLPRPKGHYRTGKNAHLLRDDAPMHPMSKPDVLKLARGTEDALTGMLWHDDAQITNEHIFKRYCMPGLDSGPGCQVEIREDVV